MINKLPYPWFGGKQKVAGVVWDALGNVNLYVEPFYGGGAVHMMRPDWRNIKLETINDIDGFVANFWRAVQNDPEQVAELADWPVNEIDLEARHRWLCTQPDKDEFLERMKHDPDYYDPRRAAFWVWGLCAWIGGGWCEGEYFPGDREKSRGCGVCDGANKRPHLQHSRGIHRASISINLTSYMRAIAERLRNTTVCCGDWKRVCTDGATKHGNPAGVFLDPPYHYDTGRSKAIYRHDDLEVSDEVRQWCVEKTDNPRFRIVLAGYEGEHNELENEGWRVFAWKTQGGMGNRGKGVGRENAKRERLWMSPSCLKDEGMLF